jgi:hypothetical protein
MLRSGGETAQTGGNRDFSLKAWLRNQQKTVARGAQGVWKGSQWFSALFLYTAHKFTRSTFMYKENTNSLFSYNTLNLPLGRRIHLVIGALVVFFGEPSLLLPNDNPH